MKKHNPKWPKSPDQSRKILIIGGSGSGKANALLNLISLQTDNDKFMSIHKGSISSKILITN